MNYVMSTTLSKCFKLIILLIITIIVSRAQTAFCYSNTKTHPAITNIAAGDDKAPLHKFLIKLGLIGGITTKFTFDPSQHYGDGIPEMNLDKWFYTQISVECDMLLIPYLIDQCKAELPTYTSRYLRESAKLLGTRPMLEEANENEYLASTDFNKPFNQSFLQWMIIGSILEDAPIVRASHHFHNPLTREGLDNSNSDWDIYASYITQYESPELGITNLGPEGIGGEFKMVGESTRARAFQALDGTTPADKEPNAWLQKNYFSWPHAREYYYKALTNRTNSGRGHYWFLTAFSMGCILHQLQDMAVPAHVRND